MMDNDSNNPADNSETSINNEVESILSKSKKRIEALNVFASKINDQNYTDHKPKKNMKTIKLIIAILLFTSSAMAQVAINTSGNNPDASAMLEITSTTKGLLIPKMTTTQRGQISNPATGLLIYQTDGETGFYYNTGTATSPNWIQLSSTLITELKDTDSDTKVQVEASTDEDKIRFDIGGSEKVIIDNNGNVGIGTTNPGTKLDVNGTIRLTSSSSDGEQIEWRTNASRHWNIDQDGYDLRFFTEDNSDANGDTRVRFTSGGSLLLSGDNGTTPANGGDIRLMWISSKAAFRAGKPSSTSWDDANIGSYSSAMGFGTIANSTCAFAMGNNSNASANFSTALGSSTIASGKYSTATGNQSEASGEGSITMGQQTKASGKNSTAMGQSSTASNYISTAMGYGTEASGQYSTAMGNLTKASGNYSIAMGQNTTASAINSTTMGKDTYASGDNSTAMGISTTAGGNSSTAMGDNTVASNSYSTAMGKDTEASGTNSTAMGVNTKASGSNSTAMGQYTKASGSNTTAIGDQTTAKSFCETTIGRYNTSYSPNSTTGWDASDRLFVIGNGTSSSAESNALVVLKNGNIGIGTSSPSCPLEINNSTSIYASYGYLNPSGATGQANGTNSYSIKVSQRIMASEFNAVSDRRVKTNFKLSNNINDLQILNQLEVTNYSYIDTVDKGDEARLGFIAQQVETIFPQAINKSINYIPNIYKLSDNVTFDSVSNTQIITLLDSHNLQNGDMIKLYNNDRIYEREVIDVLSSTKFKIKTTLKANKHLFIFGKQVDDFRAVDYDRIFVLGISAIQELSKELETLKIENNNLKVENTIIKTTVQKNSTRLQRLEKLIELQSVITNN